MNTPKQARLDDPDADEMPSKPSIQSLAREMLFACDGDAEKAVQRGLSRLRNEPKLLRSVMESAIAAALAGQVQQGVRHERASIINRATRERVVTLAGALLPCLLDIPLAGGKRLRDANRREVLEQVQRYEAQAGNMMHKARWLRLIAQAVPDEARVGDVMQEARVKELFEEARNAAKNTD